MKSKDETIKAFRYKMAGFGLYGLACDVKGGVLQRASRALDVGDEAEKLISQLYDFICQEQKGATK